MQETICFYNDQFYKKNDVPLSLDDLGFSRGYALFEHCRTYGKKIFHLEEHLIRLQEGAQRLLIPMRYSFDAIASILEKLISLHSFEEFGFKIYLTMGQAHIGITPTTEPTFIIYPYPLTSYVGYDFSKGIKVATTSYQRSFAECKTTFYLPGILAKKELALVDEILFLDSNNHVLESTIASFMGFKGDTLIIPKGALLKSVTQEVIAFLASGFHQLVRKEVTLDELMEFDEIFLCSSTKEFLPISSINQTWNKDPKNFSRTLKLRKSFEDYMEKGQWHLLESFSLVKKETLFDAKDALLQQKA